MPDAETTCHVVFSIRRSKQNGPIDSFTPQPAVVNQAQENPLDGVQDEEGIAEGSPLVADPRQQKVESSTSVSQWPQDGQDTRSFSSLRMHKYSKTLSQLLHLNS